ncbi:MAG TPA: MDR family MFS transporter [Steroidobacteraceae bacterium]|nr:MDR family MFS transporter [Steroidobacteraceae bacterium]
MTTAHFTDAERRITIIGVMIVFLLSALDQTIVATAMPVIISQLHGLELYAWVTTAYLLSSTVMVPVWGKLGDLYGRKPVLLAGIGLFLFGSWLSGLAGEFGTLPLLGGGMVQLIVFRAVQGLGGGALFTTAFAIIADLFPPRERGRFAGLFGGVFGLASAVGPLLGGYFTDHGTVSFAGHTVEGWRWVFYLNLPMGLIALFMVIAKMPKLSHASKGSIDYLGAVLIVAACVPLLLALTFGGQKYAWDSPIVIGLLSVFLICAVLFVFVEKRVQDPIIHMELFSNRVFTWANIAGFFSSMSFLSVVAFLPLFMQLGQGVQATTSGLSTLPLMIGLIVAATLSGRLVTRTGRYKPFMLCGMIVLFVATFLMSQMTYHTTRFDLGWRMALLGVGLGPLQSLYSVAIQNAVPMNRIGVVTSANQFFRQIGSTVGVAIFGTLLTNGLNSKLSAWAASKGLPAMDLSKLRGLSIDAQVHAGMMDLPVAIRVLIADSVTHVILLSMIVVLIALSATVMIPELPMRERPKVPPKDAVPADAHL